MSKYYINKARVREEAIEWQNNFSVMNCSWFEVAQWGDRFEKLGRRYGLLKEFRENGIC